MWSGTVQGAGHAPESLTGMVSSHPNGHDSPHDLMPSASGVISRDSFGDCRKIERHTLIRQKAEVQQVEKIVEVPEVQANTSEEVIVQPLIHETFVEVPQAQTVELTRQVTHTDVQSVMKEVALPIHEAREKIVEVPHVVHHEVAVEIPQVNVIDLVKQVQRPVEQRVHKHVAKPVVQIRERHVEKPIVTTREQVVEVPSVQYADMIREVPRVEVQRVEKQVVKPETHIVSAIEEVTHVEVQEHIVEVPQVEVREVVKQIPKVEVQFVEKQVPKQVVNYVERIVEVPHVVYEERIIEVPEVEIREVVRHVPKAVVQYVDKHVPKHELQCYERVVDVPMVMKEERPVEVPQVHHVETTTEVAKAIWQPVPKEVPHVTIEKQAQIVEVPTVMQHEHPVEVPTVQVVELTKQVSRPVHQVVEKAVPRFQTHVVERVVEVPHCLVEERAVEIPHVQVVETTREEAKPVVQEHQKEIPKFTMNYVEKVVEVTNHGVNEGHGAPAARPRGLDTGYHYAAQSEPVAAPVTRTEAASTVWESTAPFTPPGCASGSPCGVSISTSAPVNGNSMLFSSASARRASPGKPPGSAALPRRSSTPIRVSHGSVSLNLNGVGPGSPRALRPASAATSSSAAAPRRLDFAGPISGASSTTRSAFFQSNASSPAGASTGTGIGVISGLDGFTPAEQHGGAMPSSFPATARSRTMSPNGRTMSAAQYIASSPTTSGLAGSSLGGRHALFAAGACSSVSSSSSNHFAQTPRASGSLGGAHVRSTSAGGCVRSMQFDSRPPSVGPLGCSGGPQVASVRSGSATALRGTLRSPGVDLCTAASPASCAPLLWSSGSSTALRGGGVHTPMRPSGQFHPHGMLPLPITSGRLIRP